MYNRRVLQVVAIFELLKPPPSEDFTIDVS